jgi:DNA-binding PadR family transcriptional regulator
MAQGPNKTASDKPESPADAIPKLEQELRRGVIVLAALSQMDRPQYGYSLRQAMAAGGMSVEEGTLYPLLRRLEAQGFLVSEWKIEDGPPRRWYTLSPEGAKLRAGLIDSWRSLTGVVDGLIGGGAEPARAEPGRKRRAP